MVCENMFSTIFRSDPGEHVCPALRHGARTSSRTMPRELALAACARTCSRTMLREQTCSRTMLREHAVVGTNMFSHHTARTCSYLETCSHTITQKHV